MLQHYFKQLYQRTMKEAYSLAEQEIVTALAGGGACLDCGASEGEWFTRLQKKIQFEHKQYHGVEWDTQTALVAIQKGLQVQQGDLNNGVPFEDNFFQCIFGLSVLEHLLRGCFFLKESHRALKPGGKLVLLTPNISTFFTAALILAGKMPSSGPHPDSDMLMKSEEVFKVSDESLRWDTESTTPVHRHLVVFSYRVLARYLKQCGFTKVRGYGFGLYPFPNFMQPVLEKLDPYHCHQMVFVAEK